MSYATDEVDSAQELLDAAYDQLGFDKGNLLSATCKVTTELRSVWIETGDWQSLADQVGADKVFFVDNDPVLVFAKLDDDRPSEIRRLYEQIWCMSRPQLLFLARPGELSLFDLTKSPPRTDESVDSQGRLLERVRTVAEIQSKLQAYSRECVESGSVFGDDLFRDSDNRADRALIRDLKAVRRQLAEILPYPGQDAPKLQHLHSLIGRAIFIRYLEDREIIVPAYFEKVAASREDWLELLRQSDTFGPLEPRLEPLRFFRVLQNKDFTYALFRQLSDDFNGDTFPVTNEEIECIQQSHLDRLCGFLTGNTTNQGTLFFFAYRFEVIPIELISAIYEEFYNEHTGKERNQGSHYTPPALVEFVLAHTLTPEVLAQKPRVFDPACGSGIFLVEAFRRMVRQQWAEQNGRRVSRPQLRKILREQIAGIDINEEAVRVAAFSLYLAFLHYQEPREINEARMLPYLKWVSEEERQEREKLRPQSEFLNVLLNANSFEVIAKKVSPEMVLRFGPGSADLVVGNPPWGYSKSKEPSTVEALRHALEWCDPNKGRPVGDKELSQAFIHLSLELLRNGGTAGLLVSAGIIFKDHSNSRAFRKVWLNAARLKHIVNFSHVRQIYFSSPSRESNVISPFISVVFEKATNPRREDTHFQYWSAKRTATVNNTRSVVLNRGDMHWLSQRECLANEDLWKIYWWGGHRDEALIRALERYPSLTSLPLHFPNVKVIIGRGFQEANKSIPSGWLSRYKVLPTKAFRRYGTISASDLTDVPPKVEHQGLEDVYHGRRLLVGRGIRKNGGLTARFETVGFCFRNSVHGVRLIGFEAWQEAVITAIFWSSLAKYYYWLTSGSWGFWHDELHLNDVENMPICFPANIEARSRIVALVGELASIDQISEGLDFGDGGVDIHHVHELERSIDDEVFELYGLTNPERDLVREMCSVGMELFYHHQKSNALKRVVHPEQAAGTQRDVKTETSGLSAYIDIFLEIWNGELPSDSEFVWRVLTPPSGAPLLAVSFVTRYKHSDIPFLSSDNVEDWHTLLARLNENSLVHLRSSRVFVDTFFRIVSDREVLFIKRNEQRFWTKSAAREDAESTLVHLMNLENAGLVDVV